MVTRQLVINLNKIIDRNFYPKDEENSNLKHRPIGIGRDSPMCSPQWASVSTAESFEIERTIFRVMYHQAMSTSVDLGMEFGKYDSLEPPQKADLSEPLEFRCRRVVRSSHPPTGRTFVPGQDSRSAQLTLDGDAHGKYFPYIVSARRLWSCTQRHALGRR
jgi:hypothetical protein